MNIVKVSNDIILYKMHSVLYQDFIASVTEECGNTYLYRHHKGISTLCAETKF